MHFHNSIEVMDKILSQVPPDLALFLEQMREMGDSRDIPNISWNTAAFLIEQLRMRNIANILEIGPANGFSTMILAVACPEAEITSIECSRHAFEELRYNIQAFNNLKNAPLRKGRSDKFTPSNEEGKTSGGGRGDFSFDSSQSPGIACHPLSQGGIISPLFSPADLPPKVTSDINQEKIGQFSLYYGDARAVLPAFLDGENELTYPHPESILQNIPEQRFDFIFIDGAFRMTREFFDLSLPLLAPGGLIILDDAIKYRWKMEGFHEYLEERGIAYELVQTDPDDGVMVITS